MSKVSLVLLAILALILIPSVYGQRIDSDSDNILDEFDNCLNTDPHEILPLILTNPEFIGCSCSQIYDVFEDNYCIDVYCFPNMPLEIRERKVSARPTPCPASECEGFDLVEYETGPIECVRGKESVFECDRIVTENADVCVDPANNLSDITNLDNSANNLKNDTYVFDKIVSSYRQESFFAELLEVRNLSELVDNEEEVLDKINVERIVDLNERIINDQIVLVADITLVVSVSNNYLVEDFVLIEALISDVASKNIIIEDELLFDEDRQLIVWQVESLKDEVVFNYRITPGDNLDFDFVVQGDVKSLVLNQIIIPISLLILVVGFVVFWIINMKEKNNVFKS